MKTGGEDDTVTPGGKITLHQEAVVIGSNAGGKVKITTETTNVLTCGPEYRARSCLTEVRSRSVITYKSPMSYTMLISQG